MVYEELVEEIRKLVLNKIKNDKNGIIHMAHFLSLSEDQTQIFLEKTIWDFKLMLDIISSAHINLEDHYPSS